MKINETELLVCPKCKKEYKNRESHGYSGIFKEAAMSFLKDKKGPITECTNCHLTLVPKEDVKGFNEDGVYIGEDKLYDDSSDIYDMYAYLGECLNKFFKYNKEAKVDIYYGTERKHKDEEENYTLNSYIYVVGRIPNIEATSIAKIKVSSCEMGSYRLRNEINRRDLKECLDTKVKLIYDLLFEYEYFSNDLKERIRIVGDID